MALALGRPQVSFAWDSAAFEAEALAQARTALVYTGEQLVAAIKEQPLHSVMPYDTGALQASVRVAPPGYREHDLPIVAPGQVGKRGYPRDHIAPLATRSGRTLPFAMEAHRAVVSPATYAGAPVEDDELLAETPERITTWVGSFLHYAWWQHQGFHHVGRMGSAMNRGMDKTRAKQASFIAGRPFIAAIADSEARTFWVRSLRAVRIARIARGA